MPTTTFPTTADTLASLRPAGNEQVQESNLLDNAITAILALEAYALTGAGVAGVGNAYKVARGVSTPIATPTTIVTGLATVVAVVAVRRDAPTVKQLFYSASIGNQAGAPAAGSVLLTIQKPTAVNDVTPIAATDFADAIAYNWIAIGT